MSEVAEAQRKRIVAQRNVATSKTKALAVIKGISPVPRGNNRGNFNIGSGNGRLPLSSLALMCSLV